MVIKTSPTHSTLLLQALALPSTIVILVLLESFFVLRHVLLPFTRFMIICCFRWSGLGSWQELRRHAPLV
ncbi:hypothetical protein NC652_013705 [Populus alba x Populus x berolinensis]|nr:hypothetical protein NC652_013705 [Populus alba x Populus x berolinensis]